MTDDLYSVLARFHQDVLMPEVRKMVQDTVAEAVTASERRVTAHFDGIYQRLDRLETELHMLTVAVGRLEDRMDAVEARLGTLERRMDRMEKAFEKLALKADLDVLRNRVDEMQERIRSIEARLAE